MTDFERLQQVDACEIAHARMWEHMWLQWASAKPRFPDPIKAKFDARQPVGDDELLAAFAADPVARAADADMDAEIARAKAVLDPFLARFARPQPYPLVAIHVTRYGPGGSYHPPRNSPYRALHPRTDVSVTLQDPNAAKSMWRYANNPAGTLIHETIHLMVEGTVVRAFGLDQGEKEALVDRICTSADLSAALDGGAYRVQQFCAAKLPRNWRGLIPWSAGQEPAWTDASDGQGRAIP